MSSLCLSGSNVIFEWLFFLPKGKNKTKIPDKCDLLNIKNEVSSCIGKLPPWEHKS